MDVAGQRILLVLNQPLFQLALERALALDDAFESVVASTRGRLLEDVASRRPDVVVLEIMSSHDSAALELVEQLTAVTDARILVLAPDEDSHLLLSVLTAGAHGFVTHGTRLSQLVNAIVEVGSTGVAIPTVMLGGLLRQLIEHRRQEDAAVQRIQRLSQREREVLCHLAKGKDHNAIAASLVISPQTARTHIQNVLAKLEVHSRVEAATLALEHGIAQTV